MPVEIDRRKKDYGNRNDRNDAQKLADKAKRAERKLQVRKGEEEIALAKNKKVLKMKEICESVFVGVGAHILEFLEVGCMYMMMFVW